MDWKFEVRPTLDWADNYEDAEAYEDERRDDYDDTVQNLTAAHELWMAMLKSWAEAETNGIAWHRWSERNLLSDPKPWRVGWRLGF